MDKDVYMLDEKQNKIIENLSFDKYLEHDGMSQSALKNLAKCPLYYQYIKDHPCETEAMKFGSMLHTYILEGDKFEEEYYITPKIRRAGGAWQNIVSLAGDKKIIFEEDLDKFADMQKSLLKNDFFSHLLEGATKEISMFWKNIDTGIECKGRIDGYYKDTNLIFDLKTTKDCMSFTRSFFKFGYHIQAAFYLDAIKMITGEMPKAFIIFAIEKEDPYLFITRFIYPDSEVVETGRKEYIYLLKKYKKCKEENNFEEGLEDVQQIEFIPRWYDRLTT